MVQKLNMILLTLFFILLYYIILDRWIWLYLPLDSPGIELLANIVALVSLLGLAVWTAVVMRDRLNPQRMKQLNYLLLSLFFLFLYYKILEAWIWPYLPTVGALGNLLWTGLALGLVLSLALYSAGALLRLLGARG